MSSEFNLIIVTCESTVVDSSGSFINCATLPRVPTPVEFTKTSNCLIFLSSGIDFSQDHEVEHFQD